jgi:small subunit ribosomal protein S14
MARTCQIARETKREKLILQYRDRRKALKSAQIDPNLSQEERLVVTMKLSNLPRDSSKCRLARRCQATGAARAVYRKFRLNRISFRSMALQGLLPGITKSSW